MRHEVISDGKTVWVNGADGMCLARFSNFGIDIHNNYEAQTAGSPQCLDCKAGPLDRSDWERFVTVVHAHYGVRVAKSHAPKFLRASNIKQQQV